MEGFLLGTAAQAPNGSKEDELTPGVLLGSLVGSVHQTAQAKRSFEKRFAYLKYYKVAIPSGLFLKFPETRAAYQEGVYAHLFGLASLSRLAMINTLKFALKKKKGEGKYSSGKVIDLLNWAGRHKAVEHEVSVAKGLISRNAGEQVNLDSIRYFSEVINAFYPYVTGDVTVVCPNCCKSQNYEVEREKMFLGNSLSLKCKDCHNAFSLLLMG
ncbi:MAG: hypothetical protein V1820_01380 [archaeon]